MKAIILVGGGGTRLLPLTVHTPKPLVPLVNRPLLDHVLFLLREHGITDVILAVGYRAERFEEAYGSGSHVGVNIRYVREERPLDTGWAIKNVQHFLDEGEPFLVFNGDILTDLDISDMLRAHRDTGAIGTISLTPVEDPSSYGVVDMYGDGRIQRFTEKPRREDATSNWINAGTYILEYDALDYISEPQLLERIPPGRPYSVEYGLFPTLVQEGKPLYGYRTGAYWLDVGTPAKYLQAHVDLLLRRLKYHMEPEGELYTESVWVGEGTVIERGARITGPVVFGKGCKVRRGAAITGPAVLGDGCEVMQDAQLEEVVVWEGATFDANSHTRNSIVGRYARIGPDCRVTGISIVGDNASLGEGNHLAYGVRVWPGITLPDKAITF